MKKIVYSLIFIFAIGSFVACERDPIDKNNSIIPEPSERAKTEFDWWLHENFIVPYNVQIMYRFEDVESDFRHNLLPARLRNSEVMAQIIQHVWFDAYNEVVNETFTRSYSPRIVQLVGSFGYNPAAGTITLGTAEGGLKVTLNGINIIDEHNIDMAMMNRYFFHVIHHEFAHILHQTVMFSSEFQEISSPDYVGNNWTQFTTTQALHRGFITPYSMVNRYEDFVELFSNFITNTPEWWEGRLRTAAQGRPRPDGPNGREIIESKMAILYDYFYNVWDLDVYLMRDVVLRRSAEVIDMEFLTFDNTPRMTPGANPKQMPQPEDGMRSCFFAESNGN